MKLSKHKFKKINSTNIKAKQFAKKGYSNIVIIADEQTAGKGRFKRKWFSSKKGLYLSLLLKEKKIDRIKYYTFIAGLSVVKAIKKETGLSTSIKWPNDVYYENKKLCGILTENIIGEENSVIIGIGVNVNQQKFNYSIDNIATSLRIILGKNVSKDKLLNEILKNFEFYYNKSNNEILKQVKKNCFLMNKQIKIKTMNKTFNGKVIDIDKGCNLVLKLNNGKNKKIVEGDISLD